jgi:hypothetical protein
LLSYRPPPVTSPNIARRSTALVAFTLIALSACASQSSGAGAPAPPLPACSWPASVDAPDGATLSGCSAGRLLLVCKGSSSGVEVCLSSDPTQCPDSASVAADYPTCTEQCADDEYAVGCGATDAPTPVGCHALTTLDASLPVGFPTGFACCPCVAP